MQNENTIKQCLSLSESWEWDASVSAVLIRCVDLESWRLKAQVNYVAKLHHVI